MAVEFQFPIDKLPEKAFSYVLRTMDLVDRAAYSFISPETKQQIWALPQNQATSLLVFFSKSIRIGVIFNAQFCGGIDFYFYQNEVLDPESTDLPNPQTIQISIGLARQPSTVLSNTRGFTLKEYIDHISEVFHVRDIAMLNLTMPMDLYPAEPIRKAFDRFQEILSVNVAQPCSEQIAYDFVSKGSHCNISHPHPFGPKTLQKIFIQNLPELFMPQNPITLNDLLMMNGTDVNITSRMTYKELNRFLKSWQAGTHPRLEKFRVHMRGRNPWTNVIALFDRIRFEEASDENKMKFVDYRTYDGSNGPKEEVFKIRDIWTKDGSKKATIFLCRHIPGIQMIVHE